VLDFERHGIGGGLVFVMVLRKSWAWSRRRMSGPWSRGGWCVGGQFVSSGGTAMWSPSRASCSYGIIRCGFSFAVLLILGTIAKKVGRNDE